MTDEELLSVATDFRNGILDGTMPTLKCAMVSWPLAGYLHYAGVECECVDSDLGEMNHVWIKLADGRALDATADQFNYLFSNMNLPPVYLGERLSIHT